MANKMRKMMNKGRQAGLSKMEMFQMHEIARKHAEVVEKEAVEKAFLYMLAIPLNVLVNDYWSKTGKKKAKKFIEDVLSLYESVENGVVTDNDLNNFLWEYAEVKVDAEWLKNKGKGDKHE